MPTITIGPGGDFRHPDASAYAALAAGSTNNSVAFVGGYSYVPDASTGRWWGLDQRYGLDKRITATITGAGPAILTALRYITDVTSATYTGSDIWRIDVITDSAISALNSSDEAYFGAVYSDAAAGVSIGWRYPPADSLANVGSDGLTAAGQRAGKGIWFSDKSGDTVRLHVWCPAGSASHPATQWGGIACALQSSGAGAAGSAPDHHAFVFKPSGTSNPSGSRVTGDFRLIGAWEALIGTVIASRSDANSTLSDIVYSGITMYGRGRMMLTSGQAGTTITGIKLTGGWTYDDRIDPSVYQATADNDGKFEFVAVEDRARDCVIEDGTVTIGLSHSVLSLQPSTSAMSAFDGSGTEDARSSGNVFRRLRVRARPHDETYTRAFEVRAVYGTIIDNCDFSGFSIASKIGGKATLIEGSTWRLQSMGDSLLAEKDGREVLVMSALDSAAIDAAISVRMYRNTIDRRGDAARNVVDPWAGIVLKAFYGDTIPAGALDAQCNVFLADAGQTDSCALRIQTYGSGTVNRNQRWMRNYCATADETREALAGDEAVGTAKTAAALFDTGYSAGAVRSNVNDTAANMRRRGDLPARPAMAIGVAA